MRIHCIPLAVAVCSIGAALFAQNIPSDAVLIQRLDQNSSLYKGQDAGESLRAKARRKSGDISDSVDESENPIICTDCPPVDPSNDPWIKRSASNSDTVLIAKVKSVMSKLTPNEAFIFSDAQVVPSSVWYQSSDSRNLFGDMVGNEITVTFPGGRVMADGHTLKTRLTTMTPLVPGHTYLLFLKYLPASQSYKMIGVEGFDLTGGTVGLLHPDAELQSRPIAANKAAFIAALQQSVNRAKLEVRR